jgi:hypothetical protein
VRPHASESAHAKHSGRRRQLMFMAWWRSHTEVGPHTLWLLHRWSLEHNFPPAVSVVVLAPRAIVRP